MKAIFSLILSVILFAACKKDSGMTSQQGSSINGKWTITTVTVIPHDSTGAAMNSGTVYTEPSYYYFQFNSDLTWLENLTPDTPPAGERGNYTLHGATSFTLINVNLPSSPEECKIITLTSSSFVFSHTEPTLFNGVTPGFLEYVFQMKR
jgi:hypothetical protein